MLTREENELLTQSGPGTPMGELLRRYWVPVRVTQELPTPNGDPIRVRLLGENFVLWRDQAGKVALFDEFCMHGGTSLALGRCEGDGLRCIFHGWKFATDGTVLETPNCNRPKLRERLRAPVFPVREAGGIIWTYIGPPDKQPPLPHYPFMDRVDEGQAVLFRVELGCNWLQMLEQSFDAAHVALLHDSKNLLSGSELEFEIEHADPATAVEDTKFGLHASYTFDVVDPEGARTKFTRVQIWVQPFGCVPQPDAWAFDVPIDDDRMSFLFAIPLDNDLIRSRINDPQLLEFLKGPSRFYDGALFNGTWSVQDRSSLGKTFTGIEQILLQDFATVTSMGPIKDRSKEHLVPADYPQVRLRRKLLQAARDLQLGIEPVMLNASETETIEAGRELHNDGRLWQVLVPGNQSLRESVWNVEQEEPEAVAWPTSRRYN